nr:globin-coupled sensor protein [Bacillus sp. FJAT-45350]
MGKLGFFRSKVNGHSVHRESLIERSQAHKNSVKLKVTPNSDLDKQIQMSTLTIEDLAIVKELKPVIEENVLSLVDRFYERLALSPVLVKIIKDNSTVERLQGTLRTHLVEMFEGVIDEKFIETRIRIAKAHVRIGLEQKWYICAYQDLLNGFVKIIENHLQAPEDILIAFKAVTKLISFEQQLVLEAYDAEIIQLREAEEQTKNEVKLLMDDTSTSLAALAEETNASIEEVTAQTEEVANKSRQGTELAGQTEERAQTGNQQIEWLSKNIKDIQITTKEMTKNIKEFEQTANQIKDIVTIVQSIANETNLLALNAAIEAARAGEHGKGFAVVAEEVRKLSEQTNESVEGVKRLIEKTNLQIAKNNESITKVDNYVEQSNQNMKVTEESFVEILSQMKDTRNKNAEIQSDLEAFTEIINEIAQASQKIASVSDDLLQTTKQW